MKFTKLQGAGNDFILIETDDNGRNWASLARDICRRRFHIGADGILLLMPSTTADYRMRIFNADGSEAEACGNGLRCLVRYIVSRKAEDCDITRLMIETTSGVRETRISRGHSGSVAIQVGLGHPRFEAKAIPVTLPKDRSGIVDIKNMMRILVKVADLDITLHLVSMGNPHAVYFTDTPVADFPLTRIGLEIETHRCFPQRTNFEIARRIKDGQLEARVWERGVGETLACGSGAAAIAVAARKLGLSGDRTDIRLPGGTLNVEWDGEGELMLGGPTEIVCTGEF